MKKCKTNLCAHVDGNKFDNSTVIDVVKNLESLGCIPSNVTAY